jgi:UDP-glucose 4-epimerase
MMKTKRKALVTGGAGFIGSHLCEKLVENGHEVTLLDDLSTGCLSNLDSLIGFKQFHFVKGNCRQAAALKAAGMDADIIFHLANASDTRSEIPRWGAPSDIMATEAVLEAVRTNSISTFVFASSSTIYGETSIRPTPETYTPLIPISPYGASKLASEAIITKCAKTYGFDATILRFANVIGPRSIHGVITDFVKKLRENPTELEILGDGTQAKSFIHISDCIEAVMRAIDNDRGVKIYNVGSEDQVDVSTIAHMVARILGLTPTYHFTGGVDGGRGWIGDVKNMLLDISKLKALGWRPSYSSKQAISIAVKELL